MDPVVTARVPEGVRNRGNAILAEIGATTSELINAAYAYLIAERRLPQPAHAESTGTRTPTEDQLSRLDTFFARIAVPSAADDNRSFEELFDEAMGERYADFS